MSSLDERLEPEDAPEVSLQEHLARYRFAAARARGRVLDVACGTGYGTHLLGAVGVDLAVGILRCAARRYPSRYVAADALRLPFGRAFDTVVSFETLEHVEDPGRFVEECARVLRPGGLLILSTPNRELWSPYSARPFFRPHRREFNRKELLRVLRPFRVRLFGQRLLDRRGAAAYRLGQMGKHLLRAFLPIRRFRPRATVGLDAVRPDPVFEVVPLRGGIPTVFVVLAEL